MAGSGARTRRRDRRGQDELTRRRRLANGCCPTHGVVMPQIGVVVDENGNAVGPIVQCPRKDCGLKAEYRKGTPAYERLFGKDD